MPILEITLALVRSAARIDAAVIEINLRDQRAFPVADALEARSVPYVLATGYDAHAIPERYRHVPKEVKP